MYSSKSTFGFGIFQKWIVHNIKEPILPLNVGFQAE
jgi:hypothetical protein